MNQEEEDKRIDDLKERMLKSFLYDLEQLAFVKETNSVTGQSKVLTPVIEDQEAIIIINGEFDREDLKNLLLSRAG